MGLSKYKFRELLQESFRKNQDLEFDISYVRGISNNKQITSTKANVDEAVIRKFYIVNPGEFVYNPRTTRMGDKVGLGFNNTETPLLFSFNNIAFFIKETAKATILPEYLYMYFNRPEFDRYAMINGWGSATELFSFEEMCDIEINLPPIDIQQKYVAVYNAMLANQQSYERGLEDLKLTCDAYIDQLRSQYPLQKLGTFISVCEEKNEKLQYGIDDVKGVSIEKKFIDTKANMEGVSLRPYAVIKPDEFAYVTVTSRNGGKISLAHNNTQNTYICSSSYVVFTITDTDTLLPSYFAMLFRRSEFDRYARFHSWGSARETFDWEEMCDVEIPVPPIEIQQDIVNIYEVYLARKEIDEKLKSQIKDICPILIKGSIEESSR